MEEPQSRLTVCAATVRGIPASIAALRAIFMPCSSVWLTQPQITSSVSAIFQAGLRTISAFINSAESFSARTWRYMPFLERPIGVRTASTITASLGFKLIIVILPNRKAAVLNKRSCRPQPSGAVWRLAGRAHRGEHIGRTDQQTSASPSPRYSAARRPGMVGSQRP